MIINSYNRLGQVKNSVSISYVSRLTSNQLPDVNTRKSVNVILMIFFFFLQIRIQKRILKDIL